MRDPSFDWTTFVAENYPSDHPRASALQRRRLALYQEHTRPGLDAWARRMNVAAVWPSNALTYSCYMGLNAYAGATRVVDPESDKELALRLAKYVMWLSCVDVLLDNVMLPALLISGLSAPDKLALLDGMLWRLCAPLRERGYLSEAETIALIGQRDVPPPAGQSKVSQQLVVASNACLGAFVDDVVPDHATPGPLRLLAQESARALRASRYELSYALDFAATGRLPDLTSYLAETWGYYDTILAASYAMLPRMVEGGAWTLWRPAARACAQCCRLLNDHGTFRRELSEGKPNSVTIALVSLGYVPGHRYALNSAPMRQALELHRGWVDDSLLKFQQALTAMPSDSEATVPQAHLLRCCASLCAATYYGEGDITESMQAFRNIFGERYANEP